MMDAAGLLLMGGLTFGDRWSSKVSLERKPGIEISAVQNQDVRSVVQFAALSLIDLGVQEKAPKLKWYWRGAATIGMGLVIRHNLKR